MHAATQLAGIELSEVWPSSFSTNVVQEPGDEAGCQGN